MHTSFDRTREGQARALFAGIGTLALLLVVRCTDVSRGLGEACIRDEDCLSGACASQICVAQPPTFDSGSTPRTTDADTDATDDASDAMSVDATMVTHDSGMPPHDAGVDSFVGNHDGGDARGPSTDAGDANGHDAIVPDAGRDAASPTDSGASDAPTDG
jgi:hypothetical protein